MCMKIQKVSDIELLKTNKGKFSGKLFAILKLMRREATNISFVQGLQYSLHTLFPYYNKGV